MDKLEKRRLRNSHGAHRGGSRDGPRDGRHGHVPPDVGSENERSWMHGLHMQRIQTSPKQ